MRVAWLVMLVMMVVGCTHAPPTPDAQRVVKLDIEGTKAVSASDLKDKIRTHEPFLWVFNLHWFDATSWQADLRRLVRYYQTHGYYQARVVEEEVNSLNSKQVALKVVMFEGAPAKVTTFEIKGLERVDALLAKRIVVGLPMSVGDVFLEDRWAQTKGTLAQRLREAGYAEVVVTGEAVVDPEAAKATATVEVDTGPRLKWGRLFPAPEPNAKVPNSILTETVALEVEPGEWSSESALLRAQQRLFSLGVFSAVKVTRLASNAADNSVPVQIDVRESPFHTIRFGGGFAGDRIRQEVRAIFEYTHRDLGFSRLFSPTSRLDRLTVKAKAGVAAVFFSTGNVQNVPIGPVARLQAEYLVPRFFGFRTISLFTSLEGQRALDVAYTLTGGEARIGLRWEPFQDVIIQPAVLSGSLYSIASTVPSATAPIATFGCPQAPELCAVAALESSIEWDRRDDKLDPKSGTYLSLGLQAGLNYSSALAPYLRIVPEARGYLSFFDNRLTFAAKLKLGTILHDPGTQTPIISRFFSGGSEMRAFYQRRLSPSASFSRDRTQEEFITELREQAPGLTDEAARIQGKARAAECGRGYSVRCRNFNDGILVPVGGDGLIEASLEVRLKILSWLVLATFADAGMVTIDPLGQNNNFADLFYTGVGFGFRFLTPIGPIRLDVAYRLPIGGPLPVVSGGEPQPVTVRPDRSCFAVIPIPGGAQYSGSPDSFCSFHISIGEAF